MAVIETIEGMVAGALWFHYDAGGDVLYLRLADRREAEAVGEETYDGFILLRDMTTNETVGLTVVNASEANLNGVPVNMPQGRNTFAVFYPGEYEASLNGEYFAAPATRATVTSRDVPVAPLNLLTEATDKLRKDVGAKVKEFLDNCAAEAVKQQKLQPDCPFYFASTNNVDDGTIKWTITEYPEISIQPFGGRWVVATLDGKARVEAVQQSSFTGAWFPLNEVVDFSFTTRLDVAGDTIKVTPLLSY